MMRQAWPPALVALIGVMMSGLCLMAVGARALGQAEAQGQGVVPPSGASPLFLETGQLRDFPMEQRAVALGRTLRCVVCANQSIEDSDVELAQVLRRRVREDLAAGFDEGAIRERLVQAYGEYVSYRPSARGLSILLWLSPWLVLALAGFLVVRPMLAARGRASAKRA